LILIGVGVMELYGKVIYAIEWLLMNVGLAAERYKMIFCTAGLTYHIVHKVSECGGYDVVRFEKRNRSLHPLAKIAIRRIQAVYAKANISVGVVMDDDKKTNAYEDSEWAGLEEVNAYLEGNGY